MDDGSTASASSWRAVGAGAGLDCRDTAGDNLSLISSGCLGRSRVVLDWHGVGDRSRNHRLDDRRAQAHRRSVIPPLSTPTPPGRNRRCWHVATTTRWCWITTTASARRRTLSGTASGELVVPIRDHQAREATAGAAESAAPC